jgi:hypothetical protein
MAGLAKHRDAFQSQRSRAEHTIAQQVRAEYCQECSASLGSHRKPSNPNQIVLSVGIYINVRW